MKLKKVLAAVLAGTMVMASASMVFASEEIGSGGATAWWSDTRENSTEATIEGDGTWEYTITLSSYKYTDDDGNEVEIPPAFCVELTSTVDDGTAYITTTCYGDMWYAEAGTYDEANSTGDSDGANGATTLDGDVWTVTVERSGQDFAIDYYQNGTKMVRQRIVDSNMAEAVNVHLICQTGSLSFDVTTTSGSSSPDDSADDADTTDTTADDADTTDTTADDSASTTDTTADDSAATTDNSTTQTGDAAPIAAVAVALIGCAAIAFASKKRFA